MSRHTTAPRRTRHATPPAKPSNPPAEYDAEVRPNAIGGWEIAQPGEPLGVGNYPTSADAYSVACYNFEPARIRILQP